MLNVVCLVYIGLSSMEIKTEVDSNAITECTHDVNPATGMLGFSGTVFFALNFFTGCRQSDIPSTCMFGFQLFMQHVHMVQTIPLLGYWVLTSTCWYWVVLVSAQYFFSVIVPNTGQTTV